MLDHSNIGSILRDGHRFPTQDIQMRYLPGRERKNMVESGRSDHAGGTCENETHGVGIVVECNDRQISVEVGKSLWARGYL